MCGLLALSCPSTQVLYLLINTLRNAYLPTYTANKYLGTLPPNRTLSTVRLQGNACLSKEVLGDPAATAINAHTVGAGAVAAGLPLEPRLSASSGALPTDFQSVGPTVRQSLLGAGGAADPSPCTWLSRC